MKILNQTEMTQVAGGFFDSGEVWTSSHFMNYVIVRVSGGILGALGGWGLGFTLAASTVPYSFLVQSIAFFSGGVLGSELGHGLYNYQVISNHEIKERGITSSTFV